MLLVFPLCSAGEFTRVKLQRFFPGAPMPIWACYMDIDKDSHPDIVLIYAGGNKDEAFDLELIKALVPHEYYEALQYDDDDINIKEK